MSFLILAAFHNRNEEALNRKGVAHHGCETGQPRSYSFDLIVSGWGRPDHPNKEDEVSSDADDPITHDMRTELEEFQAETPYDQKSSIDARIGLSGFIRWDKALPLYDYKLEIQSKQE